MTNARMVALLYPSPMHSAMLCYDRAVNSVHQPSAPADRTSLTGLRVDASIGVYDFEYQIKQPLVIDVAVYSDLRRAAQTDELEHAVDYDRIAKICRSVAGGQHHRLIETVAGRIADEVLMALPAVTSVDVCVAKPGAVPDAASVSVAIQRSR